ncbi:MAG: DUF2721 domain-containing protein [Microbacter sp.]
MELSITTPALFFSAISLILLAFTNRFLSLAQLIRTLRDHYVNNSSEKILAQIHNLRKRLYLIRNMQIYGVSSLFLCIVCMLFIFFGFNAMASITFGLAVMLLLISLAISIHELMISVHAIDLHLKDIEKN